MHCSDLLIVRFEDIGFYEKKCSGGRVSRALYDFSVCEEDRVGSALRCVFLVFRDKRLEER